MNTEWHACFEEGRKAGKLEREAEILKMIDSKLEELLLDMHIRACMINDIKGETQELCRKHRYDLIEEIKSRIKSR